MFSLSFQSLPFSTSANLDWVWSRAHAIPVYVSSFSAVSLLVHALVTRSVDRDCPRPGSCTSTHIQAHGGIVIFTIQVMRLLGCLEILRILMSKSLTQSLDALPMTLDTCVVCVRDMFSTTISLLIHNPHRHISPSLRFVMYYSFTPAQLSRIILPLFWQVYG